MAKIDFYEQKNTKLRIEWMKTRPDKLVITCKKCGKTMLVFDPDNPKLGFEVTSNRYKDTVKLSVGRLCRKCVQLSKYAYKLKRRKALAGSSRAAKSELEKKVKGYAGKVAKSWKCQQCDLINSGKNKVCRSCGSNKYRWNGLKVNILKDKRSMLKLGVAK